MLIKWNDESNFVLLNYLFASGSQQMLHSVSMVCQTNYKKLFKLYAVNLHNFFLYGASLQFPKWSDFLPTFIADIDHSTWVLNFCGFFCCFKPLTSVLLLGNQMDSHFPTILLQEPFYGKCLHYSITVHCPPCVSPGSFLLCAEHIRLKEGNESEPSDASVLSLSQFHDFVFPF